MPEGINQISTAKNVVIAPPKIESAKITIRGISPMVQCKFSMKAQDQIRATQEAGQTSRKNKKKEAKDFEAVFQGGRHRSTEGWDGIPAAAFRSAMISACRTVGFKMTLAKLSIFCVADGYDEEGTGLVKITHGEPTMDVRPGRNANGSVDLRARPMWAPGWQATVTLQWDADQFSASDVMNLLARAGWQVGIGEGRPDSRMSAGMGWGQFEIA